MRIIADPRISQESADKRRDTLIIGTTLADYVIYARNRDKIVDILKNLQTFVMKSTNRVEPGNVWYILGIQLLTKERSMSISDKIGKMTSNTREFEPNILQRVGSFYWMILLGKSSSGNLD